MRRPGARDAGRCRPWLRPTVLLVEVWRYTPLTATLVMSAGVLLAGRLPGAAA
jgi:hypothetical protein